MPVGPNILWPDTARKSQPISATSIRRCGAAWQASTSTAAPAACAAAVSSFAGLTDPQRVAHPHEARDLHVARVEVGVEGVGVQRAVVEHAGDDDLGPGRLAGELPGHDVGVVLHPGEQHLVAGTQREVVARPRHRARDKVDRLGRPADEDALPRGVGVDEAGVRRSRSLVQRRRLLREHVQAAVDVGVVVPVVVAHRIDHRVGLLRRGRVVEVDQRLAVNLPSQDREARAEGLHVESSGNRSVRCEGGGHGQG